MGDSSNPREDAARRMSHLITLTKKPWPAVHGDAAGRSRANCSSFYNGLRESLSQDRGVTDQRRGCVQEAGLPGRSARHTVGVHDD